MEAQRRTSGATQCGLEFLLGEVDTKSCHRRKSWNSNVLIAMNVLGEALTARGSDPSEVVATLPVIVCLLASTPCRAITPRGAFLATVITLRHVLLAAAVLNGLGGERV